jgi:multidrug efflux pump subunit AcrB
LQLFPPTDTPIAIMSAEAENPVSYEQLEELEDDFEDVELEMRKFCLLIFV